MRTEIGSFGVWRMASAITPQFAREVETLGFGAIWLGGSPKGDLEDISRVLDATEQIPVATGIVNMWREDAGTVADSYRRIVDKHRGRFLLGVGIGHPEATEEYQRPLDKMVSYLDLLDAAGVPRDDLVLAALGPKALTLAGERTRGAHPYLTTPRHTEFAREVLGPNPLLAPEHKVTLDSDPTRARALGRTVVDRYLNRVNYLNNLLREGWTEDDLADGGSDGLIDALVLHGSTEEVATGLRAHLDAGADHVAIQVLGDDPLDSYRALSEALLD